MMMYENKEVIGRSYNFLVFNMNKSKARKTDVLPKTLLSIVLATYLPMSFNMNIHKARNLKKIGECKLNKSYYLD